MPETSSPAPLATYREHLPQVRRALELHPDRVVVHAKWTLGKRFDQTIELDSLRPEPKFISVRQRLFKRAFSLAALTFAAAVVLNRPGVVPPSPWITYALYGAAALLGGFAVMTFPKVRFARFLSRSTNKPALDIARSGPDARSFDDFIETLKRQIRRA